MSESDQNNGEKLSHELTQAEVDAQLNGTNPGSPPPIITAGISPDPTLFKRTREQNKQKKPQEKPNNSSEGLAITSEELANLVNETK